MKRKISLMLALVMVLTLIPFAPAHAVGSTNLITRTAYVKDIKDTVELGEDRVPILTIENTADAFEKYEDIDISLGEDASWLTFEGAIYDNDKKAPGTLREWPVGTTRTYRPIATSNPTLTIGEDNELAGFSKRPWKLIDVNATARRNELADAERTGVDLQRVRDKVCKSLGLPQVSDGKTVTDPRVEVRKVSEQTINVKIYDMNFYKDKIRIPLTVRYTGAIHGPQKVKINVRTGSITPGEYVYTNVASSLITLRVDQKAYIARGADDNEANRVYFVLEENESEAFDEGETVKFRLPNGFTWDRGGIVGDDVEGTISADGRELIVVIRNVQNETPNDKHNPAVKEARYINTKIHADRDARLGPIDVTVSNSKVEPQSLVFGEYVEYKISVEPEKVLSVIAGKDVNGEYVSRLRIKELVKNAILRDRYVEVTFTDKDGKKVDASLQNGQDLRLQPANKGLKFDKPYGDGSFRIENDSEIARIFTDEDSVIDSWDMVTTHQVMDRKMAYEMYVPFVVASDFSGELYLDFHGAGFDRIVRDRDGRVTIEPLRVKIADVIPAVTVKVAQPLTQVKIGLQKQPAADVIVTETKAGALQDYTEGMVAVEKQTVATITDQHVVSTTTAGVLDKKDGNYYLKNDTAGAWGKTKAGEWQRLKEKDGKIYINEPLGGSEWIDMTVEENADLNKKYDEGKALDNYDTIRPIGEISKDAAGKHNTKFQKLMKKPGDVVYTGTRYDKNVQQQRIWSDVRNETREALVDRPGKFNAVYTLTPNDSSWFKFKSVDAKVTDGDLILGDVDTGKAGEFVWAEVERKSTKPSTIKFYDMAVTLDRTVPYGEVLLKANFGQVAARHDLTNTTKKVTYFNTLTPVSDDQRKTTLFKIGEAGYTTITGVDKAAVAQQHTGDVAPFIENNRTMMPLRQVAESLGAVVNYDANTKTATFSKNNYVTSIQIGKAEMQVNGSKIPMAAKPAIVNDRMLVPVANVAMTFGLEHGKEIIWDGDTKSVTILPQKPTEAEVKTAKEFAGMTVDQMAERSKETIAAEKAKKEEAKEEAKPEEKKDEAKKEAKPEEKKDETKKDDAALKVDNDKKAE